MRGDKMYSMTRDVVQMIGSLAAEREPEDREAIKQILGAAGVCPDIDIDALARRLPRVCGVTLNFHPDRFTTSGRLVIDGLTSDGEYHNQYVTGTSNGGLDVYMGGARDLWERRLFNGAYHDGRSDAASRPKYGALNIHNYLDGASARFGSCFFTLNPRAAGRCTFANEDSHANPAVMGTAEHFYGILRKLFQNVLETGILYGEEGYTVRTAAEYICSARRADPVVIGGNLDFYIETHVHGRVLLREDIESLHIDGSFIGTDIGNAAVDLSERYGIKLFFIPERRFPISDIDDEWKGPLARPLAERIHKKFGGGGMLNAELIGRASRDAAINFNDWSDIGNETDLFQSFKYLWHYTARACVPRG